MNFVPSVLADVFLLDQKKNLRGGGLKFHNKSMKLI